MIKRRSDFGKRHKDRAGQRMGRLRFISRAGSDIHSKAIWNAICDCGKAVVVVFTPHTRSCGCLKNDVSGARLRTHGMSHKSSEYTIWARMRERCMVKSDAGYANYGGRGIRICARWNEFPLFLADMGPRPSPNHSIDRIDVNGNYEPSNCRWASRQEQARNTRANRLLTHNGKTMCVAAWADEVGIPAHVLSLRLNAYGWSVDRALTESVRKVRRRRGEVVA